MPYNPGTTISNWTEGVNSLVPPDAISVKQYAWAINCVNRGGLVQTRPGLMYRGGVAGKKAQGATIFTPKGSRPMMLVAADGYIYTAKFPFKDFVKVDGLKFSETAPIVTFQRCLKSANSKADGSIELIDPTPIVIIQDGTTNPGKYDGVAARHLQPDLGETPIGLWMAFSASRLWVFNKNRGYVSDLASPDTNFEGEYIAERDNFELPDDVTGVIETSDSNSLLVFTRNTTTAFQSNIRDRKQWGVTPDFQKIILPSIGCVAGRSVVNQYGLTWWMAPHGFVNLDAAMQSQITNKLVTVDGRMSRSKRLLSPEREFVASTYFENYLLLSAPSGGRYNEETWVGDQATQGEADGGPMIWAGVWTGVRPVQWMRTSYGGRERLFFLSFDATVKDGTQIHAWEAFCSDRVDNGSRIACQFESGMFLATDRQRFDYAEIDVTEILGDVNLDVYLGGMRGEWHQIMSTTLQAEEGSIGSEAQKFISAETILQAFKPQTRFIKTTDFSPSGRECSVESSDTPGKDKGFQLLLEWHGQMAVKSIKLVSTPDPEANRGECAKGEAGSHNMVTEEGATIKV